MSAQRIELTIRRQGHPDMTVPLPAGSIHIGRAEDNGLVLPDIAVSRRHARLHVTATGVTIEDVGSGNGTYYEGKPLRKRELEDGDEVLIDPFLLVFSVPMAAERESTETASSASDAGPPRVAGVAKLVLVHGNGMRPEYPIRDGVLTMGRAEQRDVVLPDPAASRSHAEIVKQGDGWLLKDFGSVNGTFVNSKRVRDQTLVDGDRVRIGATEFRFEAPKPAKPAGVPAAAPAAPPPPAAPSPGTKPFENLIFGLDGGSDSLPAGLGTDRTFVPKGRPAPAETVAPSMNVGSPPPAPGSGLPAAPPPSAPPPPPLAPNPSRPADDINFSTSRIPPTPPAPAPAVAPPAPPAPQPVVAAPPPAAPGAFAPVPAPPPAAPFSAPVGAPIAPPPGVAPVPVGNPAAAPPAPQPGFAPLAPPPGAAAPPPAADGGFGGVEMDMASGKRKKGRKMKMSGGGRMPKGPKQGTFMERNIRKLIVGFAMLGLLLFGINVVMRSMESGPKLTKRAPDVAASTGGEVAVASADGQANQSAIDSLIGQGNALFAEKKYLEAVEKYAAVQKLSPNNATATKMGYHACEFMVVQAMYNTITQRSSSMAEQQEAYDAAMAQADEAIERRGNIGQAIAAVQEVMEFYPEDQALQDTLTRLQSRYRGAVAYSRQKKQEEHEASIGDLFSTAQNDRNRGDSMAAIQGYQRVLAADPDKQTELYWKAEEEIRQIKAELSARGREAYRAGLSAMKSGDYITARSQFRETLRLDPFNQVAQRRLDEVQAKLDQLAQKFWSEAEIYEKTNQLEMAIGRYRKVMEYSASSSSTLSQKAKKRIDALMQ